MNSGATRLSILTNCDEFWRHKTEHSCNEQIRKRLDNFGNLDFLPVEVKISRALRIRADESNLVHFLSKRVDQLVILRQFQFQQMLDLLSKLPLLGLMLILLLVLLQMLIKYLLFLKMLLLLE